MLATTRDREARTGTGIRGEQLASNLGRREHRNAVHARNRSKRYAAVFPEDCAEIVRWLLNFFGSSSGGQVDVQEVRSTATGIQRRLAVPEPTGRVPDRSAEHDRAAPGPRGRAQRQA